jgi:hypothetical protein
MRYRELYITHASAGGRTTYAASEVCVAEWAVERTRTGDGWRIGLRCC